MKTASSNQALSGRPLSVIESLSTEDRIKRLNNDKEWRFDNCPQDELPTCARYEQARECPDLINAVRQVRKFCSDDAPGSVVSLLNSIGDEWDRKESIDEDNQKLMMAKERLCKTFERWFGELDEFPAQPWLEISPRQRGALVELLNAGKLFESGGLEFYQPRPGESWPDWSDRKKESITVWMSFQPGVLNREECLKYFKGLLDSIVNPDIHTIPRNPALGLEGIFLPKVGRRSGPGDQLKQLGGFRLSSVGYKVAKRIMKEASALFTPGDILSLVTLRARLTQPRNKPVNTKPRKVRKAQDPWSGPRQWIIAQLSAGTKTAIAGFDPDSEAQLGLKSSPLEKAICCDLNQILETGNIEGVAAFKTAWEKIEQSMVLKQEQKLNPPDWLSKKQRRLAIELVLSGGLRNSVDRKPYGSRTSMKYAREKAQNRLQELRRESVAMLKQLREVQEIGHRLLTSQKKGPTNARKLTRLFHPSA